MPTSRISIPKKLSRRVRRRLSHHADQLLHKYLCIKCSFHRKASRRAASQTLTSAFTLLYLSLLVLTLAVQVVAISNLKPAVAAVPAQAIQAPSAQNVLAGFQLFVCIGSLRLGQRPTWDLSPSDKFNSTLGPRRRASAEGRRIDAHERRLAGGREQFTDTCDT